MRNVFFLFPPLSPSGDLSPFVCLPLPRSLACLQRVCVLPSDRPPLLPPHYTQTSGARTKAEDVGGGGEMKDHSLERDILGTRRNDEEEEGEEEEEEEEMPKWDRQAWHGKQ